MRWNRSGFASSGIVPGYKADWQGMKGARDTVFRLIATIFKRSLVERVSVR